MFQRLQLHILLWRILVYSTFQRLNYKIVWALSYTQYLLILGQFILKTQQTTNNEQKTLITGLYNTFTKVKCKLYKQFNVQYNVYCWHLNICQDLVFLGLLTEASLQIFYIISCSCLSQRTYHKQVRLGRVIHVMYCVIVELHIFSILQISYKKNNSQVS